MTYAVIETGSKQYIVEEGSVIAIDKLPQEEGEKIKFENVLLYVQDEKIKLGKPYCNKIVKAKIKEHTKDKKKVGMKYQRGGYRRKFGHRQELTVVEITKIR